jgi:hypothetical protein
MWTSWQNIMLPWKESAADWLPKYVSSLAVTRARHAGLWKDPMSLIECPSYR